MTHVLAGLTLSLLTALLVILGDYWLKVAADADYTMWSRPVAFGLVLYAVSAIFWFMALKHVTLAQAGVVYSMLTLLALCAIGAMAFGEKLYLREYAGIACALLAMVLMFRFS